MEATQIPINGLINSENMVTMGYYSALKMEEILQYATTCHKKNKYCMIPFT